MHFAHVIQSRKERVGVVLIALAIVGILSAIFLFLCRLQEPFGMDDTVPAGPDSKAT
jgi:hypothetical protein